NLLKDLSEAPGPTGFEGPVRSIMRMSLEPLSDKIETDGIGSLICRRTGMSTSPKIMMSAHMDEVGLMVRYVTSDGFVKFQTLGGWLDQALIGQRWQIQTTGGPVNGITGIKTPHVMSGDERTKVFKKESIFLDIGAADKKDAEQRLGVRPGDPIAPASTFERLNGGDLLLGKAWDDRAGLAVMTGVMERLKETDLPCELFAVSTVQEEVGLRGAHTSSNLIKPDLGINLESGVAGDYPGITEYEAQEKLGGGPAVFLHDSSMLPNLKLRDLVSKTANENNIPLQYNVLSGYGEDGAEMQKSEGGTPVVNITVPTRYLHSHNSLIDYRDVENAIDLVSSLVQKLDQETVSEISKFD
ncbi:MAG: M42 family metallopeptidase, partial [Chloroflexota bacterium]|nr:M42 family metallopeptidase [Chloroflexota bacterium]